MARNADGATRRELKDEVPNEVAIADPSVHQRTTSAGYAAVTVSHCRIKPK